MLLYIQFPLADFRRFLNNETGLLKRPGWPRPAADLEFVRSFGNIRIRRGGGVYGWVGEDVICEARRAIRFPLLPTFTDAQSKLRVPLRCAFRRFYFEGKAIGKFEAGIVAKVKGGLSLRKPSTRKLLEHFLSLPIEIHGASEEVINCKLFEAGKRVARLYLASTTAKHKNSADDKPIDPEEWWVEPAPPLLFLEYKTKERVTIPFPTRSIKLPKGYGFNLSYGLTQYHGSRIRTCILALNSPYDHEKARTLRVYLLRLHAEHEGLKLVLRNVEAQKIKPVQDTQAFKDFQSYLKEAMKRIAETENKSKALSDSESEIVELAHQSIDFISPGEAISLWKSVNDLIVEKEVLKNINNYSGVFFGDFFQNIANSHIATRGSVVKDGAAPDQQAQDKIANDLAQLQAIISNSSEDELSSEKKEEASQLLNVIITESEKPNPSSVIIRTISLRLWEVVKNLSQ